MTKHRLAELGSDGTVGGPGGSPLGIGILIPLGNVTTTATLDMAGSLARSFTFVLTAPTCTISVINAVAGSQLDIIPFQDASPPRLVTHPAAVTWTSEGAPVLGATANGPDRFSYTVITVDGSGNPTKIVGSLGALGFTPQTSAPVAVSPPVISPYLVAPTLIGAPVILATSPTVSQSLTTTNGTWTNTPVFSYLWQHSSDAGATWSNASGTPRNQQSYTVAAGDTGTILRAQVTASNAAGSASAVSNSSGVVVAATNPVNGMALWLDASTLGLADGTAVATWPDASPNGWNATQATGAAKPIFHTNPLGDGHPSVQFNGSTHWMTVAGAGAICQNIGAATVYAVVSDTSGAAANRNVLFVSNNAAGSARIALGTFGTALRTGGRRLDADASVFIAATGANLPAVPTSAQVLLEADCSWSRAGLFPFQNGMLSRSGIVFQTMGSTSNTASAQVSIGCTGAGASEFWTGHIRELLVYPTEHTWRQRRQVEAYLQSKWGVAAYTNPFTTAVGAGALDTNSATIVTDFNVNGPIVGLRDGAAHIYQAATTDTKYNVVCQYTTGVAGSPNWGSNPFDAWLTSPFSGGSGPGPGIYIPAGATPTSSSDAWMAVQQPDGTPLEGMWVVLWYYTFWASTGGDLTKPAWGAVYATDEPTVPFKGKAAGSGLNILGGLILQSELTAGTIPHALSCAVPSGNNSATSRYPATDTDGGSGSVFQEGMRVRLDPGANLAGVTGYQLTIAHALQTYGAYVTDQTGGTHTTFNLGPGITSIGADYTALSQIPWAASLKCLAAWNS